MKINEKYNCINLFIWQQMKCKVFFMPIFDILFYGFSPSICPQQSMKFFLLKYHMYLLKYFPSCALAAAVTYIVPSFLKQSAL
jgi:hypothetical protein